MKKSTMTIIILAILVLGAGGVFALTRQPNDDDKTTTSQSTSETQQSTESDNNQSSENATDAVATDEVEIEDFAFKSANITIKKGTKVTWTNKDSVSHTVTPDEESSAFQGSGSLSKDATYSFTFNTVGTYSYHCQPHPNMTGTVTVTE